MTTPHRVEVTTSAGDTYPVLVGRDVLGDLPALLRDRAPAHRYAVISDAHVARLHADRVLDLLEGDGLTGDLLTFPAGEEHKTRPVWRSLTDRMLDLGVGRDGAVVALGGGVTGDLAGFVAATYMRGIPVVQLPTSLVAMIDASVGGKTGVDVPAGKNLVGAFHPPRLVLADVELTDTLPGRERSQGLAEAVKHGAILDEEYFEELDARAADLLEGDAESTERAVLRSVELKARVVSRDELEAGLRKILNFGHTLGHALEAASGYALPHGSAVAAGMVLEARLGEILGVTEAGTAGRLERVLRRLDLPTGVSPELDPAEVVAGVGTDKKARQGVPRFVLLAGIGRVDPGEGWVHRVPQEAILEVLEGGREARGTHV